MSKIMLVDGNSIMNRAFYGLPILTNSKGEYTNAIYGFMNIFLKFYDLEKPDKIAIAFDLKAPTFRHETFKEYKGTRKGMPEELKSQMPVIKELIKLMEIPIMELTGYEADDIIGTMAKRYEKKGFDVIVLSGDRDLLQVASDKIKIMIPKTKKGGTEVESYYASDVLEKMGVTPTEYIDVKALMGDTSDNIPGVPGVGEKTAFKLITEYKSLENLYNNLDNLSKGKLKENLELNKELAFQCKFLATIMLDVPFEIEINDVNGFYNDNVGEMLIGLETKTLLARLKKDYNPNYNPNSAGNDVGLNSNDKSKEKGKIENKSQTENNNDVNEMTASNKIAYMDFLKEVVYVTDKDELKSYLNNIKDVFHYTIFYDSDKSASAVYFISIDKAVCIMKSTMMCPTDFDDDLLLDVFKDIFENESIMKIGYNIKDDIKLLSSKEIKLRNYYDLMIAYYTYTLSNGPYNLYDFAFEILSKEILKKEDVFAFIDSKGKVKAKLQIEISDLDRDKLSEFILQEMNSIYIGFLEMKEKFLQDEEKKKLFFEIENPLVKVLADIESNGIMVDRAELERYNSEISSRIKELESEIYKYATYEFNISSTKQLADVLFVKLGLESKKKTKTGMSTNSEVLEKLRGTHPIIDYIIEYRQLEKIRSTYTEGLFEYIKSDGKIHTTFNQVITSTGRLSSVEPNLQNIPIRMEVGRKIRKAFVPSSKDYVFLDADYSQIELRVMAHMSGDQKLIEAYNSNLDIHQFTASQVFKIPFDEVTKEQRSAAKAVNFGIIYGISSFGLSNDINISKKEAEKYIESYFEKYNRVKEYLDELVESAMAIGFSKTMFGRCRKIDELKSTNYMQREFGKRVAMNSPVQGTAADIMKLAMIKFANRIEKDKLDAKIMVQVHDELLVEANRNDKERVKIALKEEMENAVKLLIPILVEVNEGETWYESK